MYELVWGKNEVLLAVISDSRLSWEDVLMSTAILESPIT